MATVPNLHPNFCATRTKPSQNKRAPSQMTWEGVVSRVRSYYLAVFFLPIRATPRAAIAARRVESPNILSEVSGATRSLTLRSITFVACLDVDSARHKRDNDRSEHYCAGKQRSAQLLHFRICLLHLRLSPLKLFTVVVSLYV